MPHLSLVPILQVLPLSSTGVCYWMRPFTQACPWFSASSSPRALDLPYTWEARVAEGAGVCSCKKNSCRQTIGERRMQRECRDQ